MSISVSCGACGESFSVKDEAAGRKVKCRSCGEPVLVKARPKVDKDDVDEWELPVPARPAARRPAGKSAAATSSPKHAAWLFPLIGIGVVFLMCSGIVVMGVRAFRQSTNKAIAELEKAQQEARAIPTGGATPVAGRAAVNDDVNAGKTAQNVVWTAKADPSSESPIEWPASLNVSIPLEDAYADYAYPNRVSRYIAIGLGDDTRGTPGVWDLTTGQRKATLKTATGKDEKYVLSPDGDYVAAYTEDRKHPARLWSFKSGAEVKLTGDAGSLNATLVDFAKPGQLVIWTAKPYHILVVDGASGGMIKKFEAPVASGNRPAMSVGPGGNYVVLGLATAGAAVYNLSSGTLAGRVRLGMGEGGPGAEGVAISPDGTKLACLYDESNRTSVVVTDMNTGTGDTVFSYPGRLSETLKKSYTYDGPRLLWLPDGRGWLAYGGMVIDAKLKEIVWSVPYRESEILASSRLPVPNGVLAESGVDATHVLKSFEIPWAEIDAALVQPPSPSELAFGKDVAVRLQFNVGAVIHGGQAAAVREKLEKTLQERLKAAGVTLTEDAAAPLVKFDYREQAGQPMSFRRMGASFNQPPLTVPSTQTFGTLSILTPDGAKTLFKAEVTETSEGFLLRGEPTAASLRDSSIEALQKRIQSMLLPRLLPKSGMGLSIPGTTVVP